MSFWSAFFPCAHDSCAKSILVLLFSVSVSIFILFSIFNLASYLTGNQGDLPGPVQLLISTANLFLPSLFLVVFENKPSSWWRLISAPPLVLRCRITETDKCLSVGSLPNCLQWLGVGEAKVRSCVWQGPMCFSHQLLPPKVYPKCKVESRVKLGLEPRPSHTHKWTF